MNHELLLSFIFWNIANHYSFINSAMVYYEYESFINHWIIINN